MSLVHFGLVLLIKTALPVFTHLSYNLIGLIPLTLEGKYMLVSSAHFGEYSLIQNVLPLDNFSTTLSSVVSWFIVRAWCKFASGRTDWQRQEQGLTKLEFNEKMYPAAKYALSEYAVAEAIHENLL